MSRSRDWCFTSNNPSASWAENFRALPIGTVGGNNLPIKYCVVQLEQGESGTPHLQGYVEFNEGVSMSTVLRYLPPGSHVEKRKGSRDQARIYCQKQASRIGETVELGTFGVQGKRTDLAIVWGNIQHGKRFNEIAEEYPGDCIRYCKSIKQVLLCIM